MKTNKSSNASARNVADDGWSALVERRLSADLDAFLADADEATFVFPVADSFVRSGREIVADARNRTKSRATRRAFAAAAWTTLTVASVWGLVAFGVFENVFAPKAAPEPAIHEFIAFGGVESIRAVDAALNNADQFAADSLRRVGEWRNGANVSERPERFGVAVDSQLSVASNASVGVVLKNDPLVRFVDEYYLSDFRAADDLDEKF